MNLNDLAKQERTIKADIAGETLEITYKPHVITGRFRNEHPNISPFLANCITDWDLYDGDEKVEIDAEAIREQVPDALRMTIFQEIEKDLRPKASR